MPLILILLLGFDAAAVEAIHWWAAIPIGIELAYILLVMILA